MSLSSSAIFPSPRTRTNEPVFLRVTLSVLWTVITGAAGPAARMGSGPPSRCCPASRTGANANAIATSVTVYILFLFFICFIFLFVLAFPELSSLKTHFRPFTEVMRKGRREVTWKMSKTDMANQIDDTSGRMAQLACVVAVDLLISRVEAPIAVGLCRRCGKVRAPQNCVASPPDLDPQVREDRLRVGNANLIQKLCLAFLPCVSTWSRHIATADTTARPSQGRRSRKVIIIVPAS